MTVTTNMFEFYNCVRKLLLSRSFFKNSQYKKDYSYLLAFTAATWFQLLEIQT